MQQRRQGVLEKWDAAVKKQVGGQWRGLELDYRAGAGQGVEDGRWRHWDGGVIAEDAGCDHVVVFL